jgi:hypothetical protein
MHDGKWHETLYGGGGVDKQQGGVVMALLA